MNPKGTGKITAGLAIGLLLTASSDAHADAPDILWQRDIHTAAVEGVGFTEDGGLVISGANTTDGTFRLWESADGGSAGEFSLAPHGIHSVAAVPGSGQIAVGYVVSGYPPGGVAGVWDVELGSERFTAGGCHVDVSPDGTLLASGGGGVNRNLAITRIADGAPLHSIYTGSYVHDVAYSPDGSRVATAGSDNAARLWDPETGQLDLEIPAHDDDVSAVAFSPDGQLLATGAGGFDATDDSSIRIWRVEDGALVHTLEGHGDWVYALAFSPDGSTLLSSGRTGSQGTIKLWQVADGALIDSYEASALDLAYSPDGSTFVYGTASGSVVLAALPGSSTGVEALADLRSFLRAAPNPIRTGTQLSFRLSEGADVRLSIHDASGRRVATLLEGSRVAGTHSVGWNGRDGAGRRVASGVYFASLSNGGERVTTQRLVVLR